MAENRNSKISVAMLAKNLEINGISTVIMNYCTNLDLNRFDITILAGEGIAASYIDVCSRLGIKIIKLPSRKKNTKGFLLALNKAFAENRFDIVHVHGNQASMAVELVLAAVHGTRVRIAHSHNTTCESMKIHKLLKPVFRHSYTHGFACGELAGKWLFEDREFHVIPNGFEIDNFRFNPKYRSEIRTELEITDDAYLLGHIGRLNEQKNQTFLLDIFEAVAQKNDKAFLVMVGTGPKQREIEEQVKTHAYKDRIILYGETTTPEKLYSAMDVFVFPSRFEGLPVTLLEAQISGLPCVISDVITKEVLLNSNVKQLSLHDSADTWADQVIGAETMDRINVLENTDVFKPYNIENSVKVLENYYYEFVLNKCDMLDAISQ